MKISDVTDIIEKYAPLNTAMDFDNVGLLVGRDDIDCNGVLLCVDVTARAIERAKECGCNLIVSHHPIIFLPKKNFLCDDYQSELIAKAFNLNIAIYAAHTNVDRMKNNMSVYLLNKLGAKNVAQYMNGFGAVGELDGENLYELEKKVSAILGDNRTFTVGENKPIFKVAEINGAGADEEALSLAKKAKVDLFISADLKHHIMLEAREIGLCLMSVGHYASEKCFNDIFDDILKCHFDTLQIIDYYEGNPYN